MQVDGDHGAMIECVECSMRLPLRVSNESGAVRVRCRFCGSVYRGVLLGDPDDTLRGNVQIISDDELVDREVFGDDDDDPSKG